MSHVHCATLTVQPKHERHFIYFHRCTAFCLDVRIRFCALPHQRYRWIPLNQLHEPVSAARKNRKCSQSEIREIKRSAPAYFSRLDCFLLPAAHWFLFGKHLRTAPSVFRECILRLRPICFLPSHTAYPCPASFCCMVNGSLQIRKNSFCQFTLSFVWQFYYWQSKTH